MEYLTFDLDLSLLKIDPNFLLEMFTVNKRQTLRDVYFVVFTIMHV